jgi:hypothetical protein
MRPTVTVNYVRDLLGISFPNANAIVNRFQSNEISYEITGKSRNKVFLYTPYIDLFSKL